ncbi:GntR family transcriptional regulator [Rummeliibacillus sp. JY-2-4R]
MKKIQKAELLHNQVYQILKDMIMNGEFQPGERLVETRIAENIGVSRGTLREAFQMLLKDELLIRNDKTIFVYNPSIQDIFDVYECRKSLESLAAKLATLHITDKQLTRLNKVVQESKDALRANNTDLLTNLNQEFHDLIDLSSHNKQLIQLCNLIKTKSLFIRNRFLKIHFKDFSDFIDDHESILVAINKKDSLKAEENMRSHIQKSLETIQNSLENDEEETMSYDDKTR